MDLTTLLIGFVVVLFIFGVYSTKKKRGQILCHFTGKDKTEEDKWITIKDDFVIFKNYKYDIIPKRITSFWLKSGIHMFFPTRVNYLKYSWYSRFPHDPDNYTNVWETPAVRKAINKEEWVKSYAKGFKPPSSKSQGMLMQYLPIITIVLLVIVGFYFYQNIQSMSEHMAVIENSLHAITK